MPKVNVIQTNFTAGELTPRMKGRPDVARYQNGAETIENAVVLVHGGVQRRGGLRYCATAKHGGTHPAYVLRYVFNRSQAYVLEFGHLYVRIFDVDGGVIVDEADAVIEVASPYTAEQLAEVTYHQGGDTLFLYHPDVPQHRFQRRSPTVWTLQPVPWVAEPFAEVGHSPNAKLSIDNPAVGAGRTFTTSAVAVPGAPTGVTAEPLNAGARVSFTPPADTGGAAITGYEVTSSPGAIVATGTASPITVPGLTNGVAYTFTVKAANSAGQGPASSASAAVTPLASLAAASITVTATPTSSNHLVPNGTVRGIKGPTASASDGVAPHSFAWVKVSGSPHVVITKANQAQVEFESTNSGATNYAVFRCTGTDANGAKGSVDVNIAVEHETGYSGPGETIEP